MCPRAENPHPPPVPAPRTSTAPDTPELPLPHLPPRPHRRGGPAGRTSLSPVDTRFDALILETDADSSGSRRRSCVVATRGYRTVLALLWVAPPPHITHPIRTPRVVLRAPNSIYPRQVLITAQLRRVRRKTHDTDDRYITGARVPATRVLPHEASPLSGEPGARVAMRRRCPWYEA
jgi:hypothetical protein